MDHITHITIHALAPCVTNPRRHYTEIYMTELAASIRAEGVLQPITVRPLIQDDVEHQLHPELTHEIVCGHRRHRAAEMAGLGTIPCIVRAMTDAEAARARAHENLEREDLHPLDEADELQQLITHYGETPDSLAAATGKSKSYIYARLKLASGLRTAGRDALLSGTISAEVALLIARLPGDVLQTMAAEELAGMSYREAKGHIAERYTSSLRTVSWSLTDADLVESAGSCMACPHRSGNDPTAHDIPADICQSPDCYGAKRLATVRQQLAKLAADGAKVLDAQDWATWPPGYVQLTHGPKGGRVTYADMLADIGPVRAAQAGATVTHVLRAGGIVECISGEGARWVLSEHAAYRAEVAALATARHPAALPSTRGGGGDTATLRDRSHEEPGTAITITVGGGGDRPDRGAGLPAGAARETPRERLAAQLAVRVLRDRGERDHDDLVTICWSLLSVCPGQAIEATTGFDARDGWRAISPEVAESLARRDGAELARVALAAAITLLGHSDAEYADDQLRMLALRYPGGEGSSQTVDTGLPAGEIQTDNAAPAGGVEDQLMDGPASVDPERAAAMTAADDTGPSAPRPSARAPVRYRHPITGETWSGKGLQPRWLREALAGGAMLSSFEVRS